MHTGLLEAPHQMITNIQLHDFLHPVGLSKAGVHKHHPGSPNVGFTQNPGLLEPSVGATFLLIQHRLWGSS